MTNAEAIKYLKSKLDGKTDSSWEWTEVVRLSINALERVDRCNKNKELQINEPDSWPKPDEVKCCNNEYLLKFQSFLQDKFSKSKDREDLRLMNIVEGELISRGYSRINGEWGIWYQIGDTIKRVDEILAIGSTNEYI